MDVCVCKALIIDEFAQICLYLCELSHIMNAYIVLLNKYRVIILAIVLFSFTCAFLHLQNFDPSHPTLLNASCIQGLPQCASSKQVFFAILHILVFFSGLHALMQVCKQTPFVGSRTYMENGVYIPILFDPINFGLRTGILHSRCH